jgi:hypothetical protein
MSAQLFEGCFAVVNCGEGAPLVWGPFERFAPGLLCVKYGPDPEDVGAVYGDDGLAVEPPVNGGDWRRMPYGDIISVHETEAAAIRAREGGKP